MFEAEAKERQGTRTDLQDNIPVIVPESKDSRDLAAAAVGVRYTAFTLSNPILITGILPPVPLLLGDLPTPDDDKRAFKEFLQVL